MTLKKIFKELYVQLQPNTVYGWHVFGVTFKTLAISSGHKLTPKQYECNFMSYYKKGRYVNSEIMKEYPNVRPVSLANYNTPVKKRFESCNRGEMTYNEFIKFVVAYQGNSITSKKRSFHDLGSLEPFFDENKNFSHFNNKFPDNDEYDQETSSGPVEDFWDQYEEEKIEINTSVDSFFYNMCLN